MLNFSKAVYIILRITPCGSAAGASGALGAYAARVTEAIRWLQPLVRQPTRCLRLPRCDA